MSDINIYIYTDDGKAHDIDAPADIKVRDCVKELVGGLQLSPTDVAGHSMEWRLLDKSTEKALEPGLTLEQNGVQTGQALCLRVKPQTDAICATCGVQNLAVSKFCQRCGTSLAPPAAPSDVRLHILTGEGRSLLAEVPLKLKAAELLNNLIDKLGPAAVDIDGAPAPLYLVNQDTSSALDPEKSLQENGVRDGHHLYVHQPAPTPEPAPAPEKERAPLRKPWQITPKTVIAIALGFLALLGAAGFFTYSYRPPLITVTPGASILWPSQQQQFRASFSEGNDQAVQWSVDPAIGSISSQGIYTAPSSIASGCTLRITAISKSHQDTFASATIMLRSSQPGVTPATATLRPESVQITLTPSTASLWALEHEHFKSRVTGSGNTAVTWSVDPAVGILSANGSYTAPSRTMTRRYVRITATSQADPTKSAVAIVTLKPSIAGR